MPAKTEARKAYEKKWRQENPEAVIRNNIAHYDKNREAAKARAREWHRVNRAKKLAGKYATTEEHIKEVLARGCCEICNSDQFLCVDHSHTTGKVRGLLCQGCNTFLGKLEKYKDKLDKYFAYLGRNDG